MIRISARENAYRYYLTDAINAIAQNTAKAYGGNFMKMSFRDIAEPQPVEENPEEEKSPLDVANDIFAKISGRRANNGTD